MLTAAGKGRQRLSYATHGLIAHDDLLFKNILRIIEGFTEQTWTHDPENAEMWVIASGAMLPEQVTRSSSKPVLLAVGPPDVRTSFHVSKPLRVLEMTPALNGIGNLLTTRRQSTARDMRSTFADQNAMASKPEDSHPLRQQALKIEPAIGRENQIPIRFRLKQWPPAHLTTNAAEIRLATILLGKPTTIVDLAQRSGQPKDVCKKFLMGLDSVGYLVITESLMEASNVSTTTTATNDQLRPGLNNTQNSLPRITHQEPALRANSLQPPSIFATPIASTVAPAAVNPPIAASNKPSLFNRIRARLAQQIAGKT